MITKEEIEDFGDMSPKVEALLKYLDDSNIKSEDIIINGPTKIYVDGLYFLVWDEDDTYEAIANESDEVMRNVKERIPENLRQYFDYQAYARDLIESPTDIYDTAKKVGPYWIISL